MGAIHNQESVGQNGFGRCSKSDAIGKHTEGGNTRRRTRRNSSFCCTALTCASMAHQCAKQTMLRCQAMGKCSWKMAKLSAWASAKVRECYNEVEQEDEGRKSIAAQILQTRNTDFLRRIIVPVQGHGGVTDVVRLPSLPPIPA